MDFLLCVYVFTSQRSFSHHRDISEFEIPQNFEWHAFMCQNLNVTAEGRMKLNIFFSAASTKFICVKKLSTADKHRRCADTHRIRMQSSFVGKEQKKSNSLLVCCHGWCQHLHIPKAFNYYPFPLPKQHGPNCLAHTEKKARNVNIRCMLSVALWFGPFGLRRLTLTIFDCCSVLVGIGERVCVCYRFQTFNAKPFSINTHIDKFTKRVDSTKFTLSD